MNAGQRSSKGEVHSYFHHGTEQVAWCECTLKDNFQAISDIFKQKVCSEVSTKHRCYKGPFWGVKTLSSSRFSFIVGRDYSEIHSGALKKISQRGSKAVEK